MLMKLSPGAQSKAINKISTNTAVSPFALEGRSNLQWKWYVVVVAAAVVVVVGGVVAAAVVVATVVVVVADDYDAVVVVEFTRL